MIKNICLLFIYHIIISSGDAIGSTSYHIGNSLTNDMLPDGVAAMAGEKDIVHNVGYHIRGGEGLNNIWDNPDDVDGVTDYGNFVTALPSYEWDFVILQPYYKLGSTLQTDELAIFDFVNLTNTGPSQNTIFFIYSAWPSQQPDYQEYWDQDVPNEPDQRTIHARAYFRHLYDNLITKFGDNVKLYVIPVGEVFYEIDKKLRAGSYPGFEDINDFYRDNVHMRKDVGRFTVATTAFATMFRFNPKGMGLPPTGFLNPPYYFLDNGTTLLTDELRELIQETVWEVVTYHDDTGIDITPNDFDNAVIAGVQLSKVVESDSYALEGTNAESVIAISNGEYAINDNDYTSNSDVVFPGDSIKIRTVAPDTYNTIKTVTVNIGRSSQDFHVVTQDKVEGVLSVDDSKASVALWFLLCLCLCVPLIRGWSCRHR